MADAEGEGEPQAAASTDEEKASATIVAAAKGRQQRKENAERQAAAAKIGAHAKGRRVRSKKKGGDGGDGGGAGDAAAGPADAGGGGGGDEEAAAAQKISAVAKGRHQRRVDAERRAAAAKIEAVAKGRRARKEYNDEAKKRAKETAHKPAPAPPAAGASPDTYDEPDVPAAPGVVDRGAELPMTFARPPVMYKFVGLDKSKTRKNARSYSQTYSINVEGYHRAQQTKLIITIEVRSPPPASRAQCARARRAACADRPTLIALALRPALRPAPVLRGRCKERCRASSTSSRSTRTSRPRTWARSHTRS